MKMFPGQTSEFAAKVHFFGRDAVREILSSMLAKYSRAVGKQAKTEPEEDDCEEQESKVESFGELHETLTAFMAIFCGQEEFETEANAAAYLKRAKSERDLQILEQMIEWAEDVIDRALDGKEAVYFESTEPERLL